MARLRQLMASTGGEMKPDFLCVSIRDRINRLYQNASLRKTGIGGIKLSHSNLQLRWRKREVYSGCPDRPLVQF